VEGLRNHLDERWLRATGEGHSDDNRRHWTQIHQTPNYLEERFISGSDTKKLFSKKEVRGNFSEDIISWSRAIPSSFSP